MVDTAITGMFGRNTNTQSASDTKKIDKSNAFADVMAKSMSSLLTISNGIKGSAQIKGSKTSIDNVFVKNEIKDSSNEISNTNNSDKTVKTDTLSENNQVKETTQSKEKTEFEVCDNEENIDDEEIVKNMMSEVVETIKNILGISDEEYQKAMSELGLTSADLLEPNNVANLIAQISGKQDAMSVITDSELSLKLKDVIQVVSDMMSNADSQYGISEEQFKGIAQTYTDNVGVQNQVTAEHVVGLHNNEKQSDIQEEVPMKAEEYVADEDSSLEQVISEKITTSSVNNKNSNTFANDSHGNTKQNMFENGKNNTEVNTDMTSGTNVAAQLAKTFETAFANEVNVKPADIVRQVVDSIKLNVTSQLKSMEIALNPENLGKVNLLVSVREGVVTAKIVAENEQVKKALEGQLNILKENMSNQGLKVEAVEVTVQNNAFHSQDNFNGNNPQQQTDGAKKHHVSLNFSDDEEVTEAQKETTTISENSSVEFSA